MKVLVLGSNPSIKSVDTSAFSTSTRSGRTVRSWIEPYNTAQFHFANVSDIPTQGNKPLRQAEIDRCIETLQLKAKGCVGILAIGRTAERAALTACPSIPIIYVPHPSGLCRTWNSDHEHARRQQTLDAFLKQLELSNDKVEKLDQRPSKTSDTD